MLGAVVAAAERDCKNYTAAWEVSGMLVAESPYLVPHSNMMVQMKMLWGSFFQFYREVMFPWRDNVGRLDDHRPAILADSQSSVNSNNNQDLNLYHDLMA